MVKRQKFISGSLKKGFSYGVTSGVITALGLLVGLYSSTSSKSVVLAGILTIAFADALSDGIGMHVSEESENQHTKREIWESTISTIVAKMLLGLSFVLPIVLLSLNVGVIVAIIWGLLILALLSLAVAKQNKEKPSLVIAEHLGIAVLVLICSYYIGWAIDLYVT